MGRGDGRYTREVHEALRVRCLHLLTKEAFTGIPEANEVGFEADGAIFWCDRSGQALGPDGSQVCARACARPGRTCYEPPVSL